MMGKVPAGLAKYMATKKAASTPKRATGVNSPVMKVKRFTKGK